MLATHHASPAIGDALPAGDNASRLSINDAIVSDNVPSARIHGAKVSACSSIMGDYGPIRFTDDVMRCGDAVIADDDGLPAA